MKKETSNLQEDVLKTYNLQGYEMLEKTATSGGNSGRVYVPPDWIGHRIALILMD